MCTRLNFRDHVPVERGNSRESYSRLPKGDGGSGLGGKRTKAGLLNGNVRCGKETRRTSVGGVHFGGLVKLSESLHQMPVPFADQVAIF